MNSATGKYGNQQVEYGFTANKIYIRSRIKGSFNLYCKLSNNITKPKAQNEKERRPYSAESEFNFDCEIRKQHHRTEIVHEYDDRIRKHFSVHNH